MKNIQFLGLKSISRVASIVLLSSILISTPIAMTEAFAANPTIAQLTIPSTIDSATDIAVSSDGTKLALISGIPNNDPRKNVIYTSSDSGATWVASYTASNTSGATPSYVGLSNDGQKIVATTYTSGILYISSNGGTSWTTKDVRNIGNCGNSPTTINSTPSSEVTGFAMSSDGSIIAFPCARTTTLLLSTDSGSSFSAVTMPTTINTEGAVHISKTANAIWVAKSDTGGLWKYTIGGSWSSNYSGTVSYPRSVTGSEDGTIVYSARGELQGNGIYTIYKSTDSGANFSAISGTAKNWLGIKSSGDGTKLIGWTKSSDVWISQDSGANWSPANTGASAINSAKFSSDGTKAYVTNGNYYGSGKAVYRYTFPSSSTTSLTTQSSSVVYGASNTLTATVSSNTATGTVDFKNGAGSISGCSSQTVTAGVATCTTWKPSVGTYSNITAIYSGDGNLGGSTSGAITLTVTAAPLSITASSPSVTYGAAAPSVSAASYSGLVNGDLSSVVTGLSCTSTYTTTSAVGSSPSTSCSGGSASNYSISYVSGAVTVNKATPTFSTWSNVSKVFENGDFTLTAPTVTGSLPGTFTYSSATSSVISLNGDVATVAGAGTSVITATFAPTDSATYNSATTTMTVTVAKVSPRFSTADVSKTFGAIPFSLSNPYVFRLLTGTFTFSSADTSVVTLNGRIATVVGVGTSVITATFTPDDTNNYLTGATTTFNVTVTQGAQTNALVINSTAVTYGSTLSLNTTGGSGSGSNSFAVDSGPCTVSGSTLTPTAAGTCMVTATKAANGNYLAASSDSTAITVTPKGLTVSGLTGVNKEFDRGLLASATGTPTLVGVVGSDDVLLGGTPVFTFASSNVATGITITATGYTLTGTTASNYTLTQPTVTANITAKAARVAATNTTVAFGAPVTSGVTATGLISPDAVGSASYTYTGTGTSTPPTAVGVYTVTPSSAIFSTGLNGNYSITYDTATVTILAKYTITYNANGGVVASSSTSSVDFVVGDAALTLPTPTRANYTFIGWYTLQSNGVQVTGSYTPTATATLWAHWVQNSLYGMGTNTKILTITTLSGVGNTYSASAGGGTIAIEYLADALPAGTVIDAYVLSDTSTATALIGAGNDYVMSLVLAWVATDGTVPTTAAGKAISMTITNGSIKRGSKIYSVIGTTTTLLGTAAADGSAVISITDDPQIIIAITKPDAPTGVSATSGENATTTVSWTAPSDGGSAITSYTATSDAGQSCTSVTTTCSVTGLTNGTPYTFTVTATNTIGTSDASSASSATTPAAPVVTPPSSGAGGGSTYVPPTPTVDPAVAAAAAAKALADAKAAEEKAIADAKALAEKRAAEEAELLATIKALQDKADADSLAAAMKRQDELAAQLKAEEELKAVAALKLAEEQRIAAERAAAAKKITTVYSLTSAFKLNTTYTKRLNTYTKKIATGSTVTCIGYAKSSKTLTYAKAKVVATKQAKALCSSMKKINPSLKTKSIVYPASKAPVTTVNKKWIPVSYRIESPVN
jgi:uncharacterized repeat protein (TIGR02543 family)